MKLSPSSLHCTAVCMWLHLRSQYAAATTPPSTADCSRAPTCRPDVTAKSSAAGPQLPAREEHVRRAAARRVVRPVLGQRADLRPPLQQSRLLQLRAHAGGDTQAVDMVAQRVVAQGAVAAAAARERVIAVRIAHAVTERAVRRPLRDREAQPPLQQHRERQRVQVVAQGGGRHGGEPRAGTRLLLQPQVRAPRGGHRRRVQQLREHRNLDRERQLLLPHRGCNRGVDAGRDRQDGVDGPRGARGVRLGRVAVPRVCGVDVAARVVARGARREVRGGRVLHGAAQTEPAVADGEGRQPPLLVVRMQAAERAEAGPHRAVEFGQRVGVPVERGNPHGVHHRAVRGAVAQERQRDLRVVEPGDGVQPLLRPRDPGGSVPVAERRVPKRRAEQVAVAVPHDLDTRQVGSAVRPRSRHHLALADVQPQPDLRRGGLQRAHSGRDGAVVTRHAGVVEVQ
eukprot:gene6683-biopygen5953